MVMVNSRLLFKSDMLYLRGVTAPGFFFFLFFCLLNDTAFHQIKPQNLIVTFKLLHPNLDVTFFRNAS